MNKYPPEVCIAYIKAIIIKFSTISKLPPREALIPLAHMSRSSILLQKQRVCKHLHVQRALVTKR